MRIAVWHNLPSGGGNRALYDQVRGLTRRGHHVEVWCPPTANRSFLPLAGIVEEHVVPFEVNHPAGKSPASLLAQARWRMGGGSAAMDRHCRACADEINRGGFDILLAHPCQYFAVTPIGRHASIPTCLYLQEPYRKLYEAYPRLPWAAPPRPAGRPSLGDRGRYLKDLVVVQAKRVQVRDELEAAGDFDMILVNSMFSRESILRAFGLDARVCYLGIDTDLFRPADGPKEDYVVGLGNIYDNKGITVALAAVGTIEASRRPPLVWVGNFANPPYLDRVERIAQELGVRFITKVNIPDEEVVETLGRASAMVYTSRLEPFGYAPLEANACGTVVVAVAEGGVRETVRDGLNGRLLLDSEPAALGRALLEYTLDPDRAKSEGLAARQHVEQFWGLEASIDRLEGKLRELVGKSRPATATEGVSFGAASS